MEGWSGGGWMDEVAVSESEVLRSVGKRNRLTASANAVLYSVYLRRVGVLVPCPLWKLSSLHRAAADELDGL